MLNYKPPFGKINSNHILPVPLKYALFQLAEYYALKWQILATGEQPSLSFPKEGGYDLNFVDSYTLELTLEARKVRHYVYQRYLEALVEQTNDFYVPPLSLKDVQQISLKEVGELSDSLEDNEQEPNNSAATWVQQKLLSFRSLYSNECQ